MNTPVSSMVLVACGSFIGSFGAVFLKAGAGRLKLEIGSLLRNWPLALGITCYLVSTMFFISGVKRGELSVLYPLVSLGFMWTMLWSRLFFKETITRNKIIGVVLILCGVALLGFGGGAATSVDERKDGSAQAPAAAPASPSSAAHSTAQ